MTMPQSPPSGPSAVMQACCSPGEPDAATAPLWWPVTLPTPEDPRGLLACSNDAARPANDDLNAATLAGLERPPRLL